MQDYSDRKTFGGKVKIKYTLANANLRMDLNIFESPLTAYLKVTDRCMLNCIFCSQHCNCADDMSLELAQNILRQLHSSGIRYIYYTGGEPLLNPKIKEILSFGKSLGFIQILVTNALLLTDSELFSCLDDVDGVGVSLHGNEEIHDTLSNKKGTYKKVLSNINKIKKVYPKIFITINCTLVDKNISKDSMFFLANYCKNEGFQLNFARLNYVNKGRNFHNQNDNLILALKVISELKDKGFDIKLSNCIAPCVVPERYRYLLHGCAAGFGMLAFEANGDVKICPTAEYVLGNINKLSLKKIWNCKELKIFRSLKWLPSQCTSCSYILNCKGGCHAENNGEFWKEISDQLVADRHNEIWDKIKEKRFTFIPTTVRKDYKNYTLVHFPARLCSSEVIDIIKKINEGYLLKDVLYSFKNDSQVKNLLISFKIDNLLSERI